MWCCDCVQTGLTQAHAVSADNYRYRTGDGFVGSSGHGQMGCWSGIVMLDQFHLHCGDPPMQEDGTSVACGACFHSSCCSSNLHDCLSKESRHCVCLARTLAATDLFQTSHSVFPRPERRVRIPLVDVTPS